MHRCMVILLSAVLVGCGTVPHGPVEVGGIWIKNSISESEAQTDGIDCRNEAAQKFASSQASDPSPDLLGEAARTEKIYPHLLKIYAACLTARGYQWSHARDRSPVVNRFIASR